MRKLTYIACLGLVMYCNCECMKNGVAEGSGNVGVASEDSRLALAIFDCIRDEIIEHKKNYEQLGNELQELEEQKNNVQSDIKDEINTNVDSNGHDRVGAESPYRSGSARTRHDSTRVDREESKSPYQQQTVKKSPSLPDLKAHLTRTNSEKKTLNALVYFKELMSSDNKEEKCVLMSNLALIISEKSEYVEMMRTMLEICCGLTRMLELDKPNA